LAGTTRSGSNTAIATVDPNGKIVAKKVGKATHTVTTVIGAQASMVLTVTKGKVTTKKIAADVTHLTLASAATY
jgi:uncharacterized protein YjdB